MERQQENVRGEEARQKEERTKDALWKAQEREAAREVKEMKRRKMEEEEHQKKLKEEEEEREKARQKYMKDLEDKAVFKHRQEILTLRADREERAKHEAQERFSRALIEVEHDHASGVDGLFRETRKEEATAKGEIALARQRLTESTRQKQMEVERKRKGEESKIKRLSAGPSAKAALQNLEKSTAQKCAAIDKEMINQKKILDQQERDRIQEIEKEFEKKKAGIEQTAAKARLDAQHKHDQAVTEAQRHTQEEETADTRQAERHKMDSKFSGKKPGE